MVDLSPRQERMRSKLIEVAKDASAGYIRYKELADAVPIPFANIADRNEPFADLWHVSVYEHEHGRPLLSALVVNQDYLPGEGFFKMAALEPVYRYSGGSDKSLQDVFAIAEVKRVWAYWRK